MGNHSLISLLAHASVSGVSIFFSTLVVCRWKIGPHPRIHCLLDLGSICPFLLHVLYHGLFQKQSKVSCRRTPYTFRKVVKCVKPQGFPLKSRQNIGFLLAIFFDGQMKEKLHEPQILIMHPLFHDQPLSRIQATVHNPAIGCNPAVQWSEAYSTFKAFKFGKKKFF